MHADDIPSEWPIDRVIQVLNTWVDEHGKLPTWRQLSVATSIKQQELKLLLQGHSWRPESHLAKLLTDRVIVAIYQAACGGNTASQRLWLQVVENWFPGAKKASPEALQIQIIKQENGHAASPDSTIS